MLENAPKKVFPKERRKRALEFEKMIWIMEKFSDYDIYKYQMQPRFHIDSIYNYYSAKAKYSKVNE